MSSVIRSLMVKVGADTKDFQNKMKNISKDLTKTGREISKAGKQMTMAVTLPIAAAGTAAFKMAADMQDAMGATDQIFGNSSENMKNWAKGLESYYGIAQGEALEYGNMMGSMLQNIGGLTEEAAAEQSQTLIKLAGDLTAMYGGTTEDAVRALTGALKGNNTMLDNYGMAVNDAMIKTKAFEMGLYDGTGAMDLQTKQAATLALITEQSGAAQGQAAREAEGASGSMRALMTEVKNLGTSIGTVLLPMITPIISKINEWIKKFGALDEGTKKNIVTIAALAAGLGPVTSLVGGLTSGVGTAIGTFGKFSKAISGGSTVIGALSTVIGPGGVVMLGMAAFATAAVLIYQNWDKITAAVKNAIGWVKEFLGINEQAERDYDIHDYRGGGWNQPKSTTVIDSSSGSNVRWNAAGAIFNRPTVLPTIAGWQGFGEAGPEIAMPLSKLDSILEKNAQKSRQTTVNLNVGTLIADDYGLKQLERKLKDIRISENGRLGGALA